MELPPGVSVEEFLGGLVGRWMGNLRWVGLLDDPEDPRLVWSVPGIGGRVVAAVRDGRLLVTVESADSPPPENLLGAAHDLVVFAIRQLGRDRRARSPSLAQFAREPPAAAGWNN